MKNFAFYSFLTLFLIAGVCYGEIPKDYDLVSLKSGTLIEGSILVETSLLVTIETLGGSVSVPVQSIEKVIHARQGESEIMLGLHLLEQNKFERAERFLKKSSVFTEWREACKEGLARLEKERKKREEERQQEEQQQVERLIQRKGLQAGIDALEKRYKNTNNPQDEYWGSVRGKLHLMMARDSIDHLDLREAERQLVLAEKYGADSKQWEAVRKELLDTRRESVLLGPNKLASKRFEQKKPRSMGASTFIAAVQKAGKQGHKIPPFKFLQMVDRYSRENRLDPLLVWAMIDTESSWRIDAVSPVGAQGLMQLMPPTAKELEVADPFNPEENIRGGTSYLRFLLEMFNDVDTALAAYNVGPGRVERTGIPPAGKRYIKKVRTRFATLQKRFGTVSAST